MVNNKVENLRIMYDLRILKKLTQRYLVVDYQWGLPELGEFVVFEK